MISYEVENQAEFNAFLAKVAKVGTSRFIMGEMARIVKKFSKANFILKGSGQYPPLSERYKKRKSRIRPAASILVFDGDLRDSIVGNTEDSILKITNKTAIVGTSVPYAKFHDKGFSGTVKRKNSKSYNLNLPQRKPLFLTSKMVEQILKNYSANVDKQLKAI